MTFLQVCREALNRQIVIQKTAEINILKMKMRKNVIARTHKHKVKKSKIVLLKSRLI